jgi:hypothetical protein
MATERQIAANRRNAERSTGPRTAAGKERSRRNALRHGLAAEQILLIDESADDFAGFAAALRASWDPVGEAEEVLCERIVLGNWRMRRVWRAEAAAMNEEAIRIAHRHAREEVYEQVLGELQENPPPPDPDRKAWEPPVSLYALAHDVVAKMSDAQIEEAVTGQHGEDEEGATETAARAARAAPLPEKVPQKPDTFAWPEGRMTALMRYESALERALHRATVSLERLQARRREMETATEAPARPAAPLSRQERRWQQRARAAAAPGARKSAERSQFRAAPAPASSPPEAANGAQPPS